MEQNDFLTRVEQNKNRMSSGQHLICDYILTNYDKAAFMTASKLAQKVGVSESTVVRFAESLGYEGYPKLKKALQEMIRNKLTSLQRIELMGDLDPSQVLNTVIKSDLTNLKTTLNEIDNDEFCKIIDLLFNARTVYILGLRSSAPLAQFLGYYLDFVLSNVKVVTSGVGDIFEQMLHINENDVLFAISFPRYSARTIDGLAFAKKRNARTIAFTDSLISPLAAEADHCLLARSDMASFVDSLVAPFSVVNALIVATSLRKKESVSAKFEEMEATWDEFGIYLG
ncbi:MAG TPA: MurR/RpiR family transcriptional regulator [Clostridia bacterium]|mgnify:CR=1 FL=1|nr:MurR/RpiR family transcriptional regulator [Clostridia bacterium]